MLKKRYIWVLVIAMAAGIFMRGLEEKSFEIVRNSVVYAPESETVAIASEEAKLININEADAYDFARLPGVGETLGKRIVDYREKFGKFEKIQDIMKVEGIGEKIFEDIKNQICV